MIGSNILLLFQDVVVNKFSPTQGPVSGGTVLTIEGRNLNISSSDLSVPKVMLGDKPCIVFRYHTSLFY